jgi:hypothetical protein
VQEKDTVAQQQRRLCLWGHIAVSVILVGSQNQSREITSTVPTGHGNGTGETLIGGSLADIPVAMLAASRSSGERGAQRHQGHRQTPTSS